MVFTESERLWGLNLLSAGHIRDTERLRVREPAMTTRSWINRQKLAAALENQTP